MIVGGVVLVVEYAIVVRWVGVDPAFSWYTVEGVDVNTDTGRFGETQILAL